MADMFLMSEFLSWCALFIGGCVVLYLLWGVVKAGVKLFFYAVLLILFLAFLKRYDLLPSQISRLFDHEKVITEIKEHYHDILPGSRPKCPDCLEMLLSEENKQQVPTSYSSKSALTYSSQDDEE